MHCIWNDPAIITAFVLPLTFTCVIQFSRCPPRLLWTLSNFSTWLCFRYTKLSLVSYMMYLWCIYCVCMSMIYLWYICFFVYLCSYISLFVSLMSLMFVYVYLSCLRYDGPVHFEDYLCCVYDVRLIECIFYDYVSCGSVLDRVRRVNNSYKSSSLSYYYVLLSGRFLNYVIRLAVFEWSV